MRRFWLPILLFGFLFTRLHSQSPLDAKVSIQADNLPLEQALYNLIEISSVKLSFSNNILPKDKVVTLNYVDRPLREVLDQLLEGTEIEYRSIGSQVVLTRKSQPVPEKRLFTSSGFVKNQETGEFIAGAVVQNEQGQGTYTNDFGYFSLTSREEASILVASSLGYETDTIFLTSEVNRKKVEIGLKPAYLAEIIVNSMSDSVMLETNSGTIVLNVEQALKLTSLGGEADLMRVAFNLPGIQTGTDGVGGISVRGGNVDQNLFLLDGVPVYNALHGLGIFSIYSAASIRSAKVMKGVFPAQYGGRVSSVWDIQTKEGNSRFFTGSMELGVSSAQLTLEGPISKGSGSYFISGRRALFDFFSVPLSRKLRDGDNTEGYLSYYFSDLNFKANYEISPKDRIYLSLYRGRDHFKDVYEQQQFFSDTLSFIGDQEKVNWGNNIVSLRWNRLFSEKLFGNATLTFSQYLYQSEDYVDLDLIAPKGRINRDVLLLKYDSDVQDFAFKTDFDYSAANNHRIRFGASIAHHDFQPGIISFEEATVIDSIQTDTLGSWGKTPIRSLELDSYVQDEFKAGEFVELNFGLRASALVVGEGIHYSLQPRVLVKIMASKKLTFNLSAGKMTQFLHLLSPSTIGLPKDLWVSATSRVPPQHSWQLVAGASHQLNKWWSMEFEGYYKTLHNLVYFQGNGIENINGLNWQNFVSAGQGWAYGAEGLIKVEKSKLGGWLAYTYSKTDRKFGLDVNQGQLFPYRLDRRHNLNLQFLYKFNPSWEFTAGFNLSTGTAFNFPSQQYDFVQPPGSYPTAIIANPKVIEKLNGDRFPVYHRLDFAFNHYFWVRNVRHSLKLGVYNAYFRQNPLYYTLRDDFDENGVLQRKVVQVSLLPIFPAIRYSLQFK